MTRLFFLAAAALAAGQFCGVPGPVSRGRASVLHSAGGSGAIRPGDVQETSAEKERLAKSSDTRTFKVIPRKEGETTRFFVENDELCEITVTFDMKLTHLKSSVELPYTATFPPGKVSEAFTVEPDEQGSKWSYAYTNYYKLGSNCAQHDDSFIYELPYAPGRKFRVTQGYNGHFSHTGSNRYATDWQMPEGTPVYAARGGLVVRTKDDSSTGGPNIKFDPFNNYVLIRHDDGTLGHYCHLQKGGVCVRPGQIVRAGDLIAHSGTTGFSSGPHLHFCVFKALTGRERESIPVKFRTAKDVAVTLVSGRSYRSVGLASREPALATQASNSEKRTPVRTPVTVGGSSPQ